MTLRKSSLAASEEAMVDSGAESDDFDVESSDDGFDDEVPDLSSFESSSAPSKKRKSKQKDGSPSAKKFKGPDAPSKTAPLTADELIYLKETENLFQSNVFRLQISELVSETRANQNCRRHFPQWFQSFTAFLETLEGSKEIELKNCSAFSKKIKLPVLVPENVTGTFGFIKPAKVLATGCFVDGTTVGPPFSVDIVLVMPKSIFKKSDKFDQQYLVKRALYLCHVASLLKKSDLVSPDSKVQFVAANGDALKPCLTFKANGKALKPLDIVISAVPESGTFKLTQFTPDKCNISSYSQEELKSTPYYNATVCEDLVLQQNEELKKSIFESNQNIKDAAVLIGVWLKQRELSQGYGAFDMNMVGMYLAYMLKNRRINTGMSSNQIIRTFWLDITGKNDWTSIGPSLYDGSLEEGVPPKDVFHGHFDVVFVDVTGFHNIAHKMRRVTFRKVQKEAEHAIKLLNNKDSSCFQALFLKNTPFLHQYDNVVCFPHPAVTSAVVSNHAPLKLRVDHCLHELPIFSKMVLDVLEKGLSSRLESIGISLPAERRWDLNEPPSYAVPEIMFGLQFNPDTALSVIDKGPPSNTPEGVDFREFWGDKCQLRRFKDGSISESVIWAENTLPIRERREIVRRIVLHLMEEKFGVLPNDLTYVGFQLNHLNTLGFAPHRSPEESCLAMHKVFTKLSQDLHDLKLPLEVVSVHCIAEAYRFTDPFPPMKSHYTVAERLCQHDAKGLLTLKEGASSLPPYTPTIDVVVQMSISGKWPEDLKACKRLVAAFYVAIADEFKASKRYHAQVTPDFVLVLKDSFVFRIFLGYSKQISILKQRVTDLGVRQYRDTEESVAIEKRFINLPKLSGAMFGLSQRYTSFGATCVMAKRWVSAHMFHDSHVPSVVVELLVAHLYLSSQPLAVSMHPLPMFLRFLKTLSSTNYHVEPIIVNFNESLDRNAIADIEKHFTTNRETLPPLFVATPFDTTGVLWTKKAPSLPVLVLLAKLAAASVRVLESSLSSGPPSEITKTFKPPVDIYHFVIKLDPLVVTRRHHRIEFKEQLSARNLKHGAALPVVDFDPVASFVQLLEDNYRDQALFFYDKYGGSEIGVVLKPQFTAPTPLKVSSIEGRVPVGTNGETTAKPDLEGLAEGFKLLGSGLVVDVAIAAAS